MRSIILSTLLLAASAPALAANPNLVANGDFFSAADLLGWQPGTSAEWATLDRNADPSSGSAYASNDSAGASTRVTQLSQCIPLTQRGQYRYGASGYVGQTSAQGSLIVAVIPYPSADCTGGSPSGVYLPSNGAWTDYGSSIAVPALPAAIEVLLIVQKDQAGGTYGGYFDNVYLVLDTVFIGDFE